MSQTNPTMNVYDNVCNIPSYAKHLPFWVVRFHDHKLWFYGAYDDVTQAQIVAVYLDNGLLLTINPSNEKENTHD